MAFYVQRHTIVSDPGQAVEELDAARDPAILTRRLTCGWFEDEGRAQRLADRLGEQSTFWGYSVIEGEPDGPAYSGRDRVYVIVEHEVDGFFTLSTDEGYFARFLEAEARCEELTTSTNKSFPPRVETLEAAVASVDEDEASDEEADDE